MARQVFLFACSFLMAGSAMAQAASVKDLPAQPGPQKVHATSTLGSAVEKPLPPDRPLTPWKLNDTAEAGDRVEIQKVLEKKVRTIKLPNVVPPILFGSGESSIPAVYIERVRKVLEGMKDRNNVRLHLVGHTDNVQLFGAAKARYGDNAGLARERAGVAAEFFQKALNLPPEGVSYEGMGERQPVASNATPAGRAKNRRMEVEVWYDEIDEALVDKEVVVQAQMKRVKVCRVETMCKLSYKAGHARRTRVKNLISPFHYDGENIEITPEYQQKLLQALGDLSDKQGVVVRFTGHTDSTPLMGRDERIYGNHLGLSKARARRVAQALQDALKLPASAVESDGKGAAQPVGSNDTDAGRAANRRVEVEFWYDDALQTLSSEPQLCPEAAASETVTRVYHSPKTTLPPVVYENSKPVIPPGFGQDLASVMAEIKDKARVRVRFVGYTNNDRLDRRTALAYGDDIGLSTARARTVMDALQKQLGLTAEQVEHEGRGYVQSDDVVNTGFTEAEVSRVEAQVVYDELAALDNQEGLDITRVTREVQIANPYALNLMRITVDGKPLDDPGKSSADIQRCTDVNLEKAKIQFKYDNLNLKPRLNVTAWPNSIRYQDDPATDAPDDEVQFRAYSNFAGFIAKSEVRLFDKAQSLRDAPLAIVALDKEGRGQWRANFPQYGAAGRDLQYVLRVYDKDGNFDETSAQTLWIQEKAVEPMTPQAREKELLVGYGENRLAIEHIDLHGGTIKVQGARIPAGHRVAIAGREVPVVDSGEFVAEEILPQGLHTVEVSVLDQGGNGELYLRDLSLDKSDWFYVAIADVTASKSTTSGPAKLVTNNDAGHYDNNLSLDGRLAFFTTGKFGDQWQLTASADTLEGPVGSLFSNFMQKTPDAMFRRINPDYYYPTYGDDSTSEEAAPTLGKFYAKLRKRANYGLWGNFKVGYTDNSLAHVDRTLYGANLHLEPAGTTSFGEKRLVLDGFAAQPGTVAGRDEFRGTGGSLYYLKHQDVMSGSERVRIEIRDKASGMVVGVKNLVTAQDYTIDYLQGRVVLSAPLSPVAQDNLLVVSDMSPGNEAYLVVRYEYSTGFEAVDNLSTGGRVHYWVNDNVKIGATANKSTDPGAESRLGATDVTLRKTASTWLKFEQSSSAGAGTAAFGSNDGGFNFGSTTSTVTLVAVDDGSHGANRIDASVGFKDVFEGGNGQATFYRQSVDAGYSAPGLIALTDIDQYGGSVKTAVSERVDLRGKLDKKSQQLALQTSAVEINADYKLDTHWTLSSGLRRDSRTDRSPVVPLTQVQGDRTDLVFRAGYDSRAQWTAYGYVQGTASSTGNRESNGRFGSGGSYRLSDRARVNGELSTGDMGLGARLGTEYLVSDRTTSYLSYGLENERSDNGVRANKGNMIAGAKSHYSDTVSVFAEEKYTHGDAPTGLMHATGIEYAPNDRWNFSAHVDAGTLRDHLTGAQMERSGMGLEVGYGFEAVKIASVLEFRNDQTQSPIDLSYSTRKNWLTKNSIKYQLTPDWRVIGRFNHSVSKSSLGELYDGGYTEAVLGYGYRPVANDRLNLLFKYTYFENQPAAGQVLVPNTAVSYIQRSNILSVDAIYDLTRQWSVGGKYARKVGQVSQDRVNPVFFDSNADLWIARVDWHVVRQWDLSVEARRLTASAAEDARTGALVGVYRHLSDTMKLGVGWNFTDFSDDLTNLSYTHQGLFLNLVGKF